MKIIIGIFNFFGKIFARIMAPFLVIVLVAITVMTTVSELVQPEKLRELMPQLELPIDEEMTDMLEQYGGSQELVDELKESLDADAIAQLLETYGIDIETMLPAMSDLESEPSEEDNGLTNSESEGMSRFNGLLKVNGKAYQVIELLQEGNLLQSLTTAAVILSFLIVICRWKKFEGFCMLGSLYLTAAVLSLIIIIFAKDPSRLQIFGIITEEEAVKDMLMPMLADGLTGGTLRLAGLAVVFFAVYVCRRLLFRK